MDNNNGNINYEVGADVSAASAELQKLKAQINGTTANLQQSQATIQNAVNRMTADIQKSIASAKAGSDQLLASLRRLDRVQGNTLSSQSRGNFNTQLTGAAGQQLVNEARNSAENVTARITNELVNQFTQRLRAMDNQVEARIRQAQVRSDRLLANSAPEVISARSTLNDRSNTNAIRRAEVGDARFGMEQSLERISSNGGADIITIQARLLAGYQALSLAMNGIQGTAQFVVGLDAEFRQFQAITATTNYEMIQLKDNLIGVSEASKFTALEIAEAATVMGQAGLSAQEVSETIGSVAELATAAGSSLAESVDVVTSTMSIFNLQTSQAADVANTLTAALNLSKLSMDKLVLGFQYAGNTAAQMGITYQELTGVLGALANSGIRSGSTLGTGLRQLLIDIQNPSKELIATLKELGLTQEDINVESNGLINVLETLKTSGFGAAQAFESFEVRAAAAYAALSNNTDLAVELQQQFILSSAAAEANAVQMESLTNTYLKFQSVVGTVAYNATEPLLAALQDLLDMFSNLIAMLNKIPGVLQVVTIALTAFGTAIALSSLSALLRGLAGAIPLFGQLGAAATGAAGGIGLLNAVMKINPFTLLISVLAAGATAFYAFGQAGMDAAEKIDAIKAEVNTFAGQVDAAESQVEAITQTISNLIRQKEALDADPLMRTAKILEVKQAFKEIAGEVDTTTGSVEELIDALNRLADGDFDRIGAGIRETIAANDALIAEYQALLENQQANAPQGLIDQTNAFANLDPLGMMQNQDNQQDFQKYISDLISRTLGEKFGDYADMVFDPSQFPTDISDAQVVQSNIGAELSRYSTRQTILQNRSDRGEQLTSEELEELNRIPYYLELLQSLKDQIQPLVATRLNIAATESANNILRNDQLQNDARTVLADQNVSEDIQTLQTDITARYAAIRRESGNMSAEELMVAYQALEDDFKARVESLKVRANNLVDELMGMGDYTKEEATNALSGATNDLGSLSGEISTESNNRNKAYNEVLEEALKVDLEEIDDQIQLQISGRTRALTASSLDVIEDYVREKFDQKRQITERIFGAQIAQEEDDDAKAQLETELRAAQREINRSEQDALLKIGDDRKDLQVDIIEDQKKALDEEVKLMQTKLTDLITQIGKASPGPAMDALIARWQQVAMAQQGLIDESNALGIQGDVLKTGAKPISGGTATNANKAMEILMSLGYTRAQASGVVGNLIAESGMNSSAVGDNGMAFGLGQWHPDRQALLEDFAAKQGTTRDNFDTQVRFIDWELKNSPKTAGANTLTQLQNQTTAAGAADVFRRLYERPSLDPEKGNHAGRIGYAKTLEGIPFNAQVANDNENIAGLAGGVQTGTNNSISASAAAAVKAATQQIQTLTTQAGITSNPESIKGMIETVSDLYAKIIEEQTKKFDAENDQELAANDPAVNQQRDDLIAGLKADQNQKTSQMLETYWKALDEKIQEPLEDAQQALEEAQKPENVNKFTQADILTLENNVRIAERKVLVDQLTAAQELLAQSQARVAETEAGSTENNYWLLEEARALEVVNELTRQKNAADAATVAQAPSVTDAIQSATEAWAMQNGILDEAGEMIPLAKQVENAWGGVLDTLTTGFSTLFVDLAKGTMTAEEAFKKFSLSVIDSFMQMIAKALAMQVVMGLMGGTTGGGGFDWLGNLLGVATPAANGEYIRGAANGEVIPGISNRDSVLRKVMPGEMILRRSAVSAIGEGALQEINDLGSRTLSEGVGADFAANDNTEQGVVNVWVVSPDQVPPMGPKDVIAAVASDIQRRGSIKQLIQQVSMGTI